MLKLSILLFLLYSFNIFSVNIVIFDTTQDLHSKETIKSINPKDKHYIEIKKNYEFINPQYYFFEFMESDYFFHLTKNIDDLILSIYSPITMKKEFEFKNPLEGDAFKKLVKLAITVIELEQMEIIDIFDAIDKNNLKIVKEFIKRGDINKENSYGTTPLLYAFTKDKTEIYSYLLQNNANPYIFDNQNNFSLNYIAKKFDFDFFKQYYSKIFKSSLTKQNSSLIHFACWGGKLETVKFLISEGFDINLKTTNNKTALHFATQSGDIETVKYLIESGLNVNDVTLNNESNLHFAVQSGNIELIDFYLEKGLKFENYDKETFIYFAILSNNIKVFEYLTDKGINLSFEKNYLHDAVYFNKPNTIKYLIDNNYSLLKKDENGKTPLLIAFQTLDLMQIQEFLLKEKVNINDLKDNYGFTCFHYAVLSGNFDKIKYLIKNNIDIFSKTNMGENALYFAMMNENKHLFIYLFYKGLSIDELLIDGDNYLHQSINLKNNFFFNFLKKKNPNLIGMNKNGESILHIAVRNKNKKIIKELLEEDFPVNIFDKFNNTPLNQAILANDNEIFDLIIQFRPNIEASNFERKCPLDLAVEINNQYMIDRLNQENAIKCK